MAEFSLEVAYSASKQAVFNLETIVNLIDGQDKLAVSGHSLASLLRPIQQSMFEAYEKLECLCKKEDDELAE